MTYSTISILTLLGIGSILLMTLLFIVHWIIRFAAFGIRMFLEPIIAIMKRT